MRKFVLTVILLAGISAPAWAQYKINPEKDCYRDNETVTLTGSLSVGVFAGPPNYTDIAKGDKAERIPLLFLGSRICVVDPTGENGIYVTTMVQIGLGPRTRAEVEKAKKGQMITLAGRIAYDPASPHYVVPVALLTP